LGFVEALEVRIKHHIRNKIADRPENGRVIPSLLIQLLLFNTLLLLERRRPPVVLLVILAKRENEVVELHLVVVVLEQLGVELEVVDENVEVLVSVEDVRVGSHRELVNIRHRDQLLAREQTDFFREGLK
jgi:hypothetical protein